MQRLREDEFVAESAKMRRAARRAMGARMYMPEIGRFLSVDPLAEAFPTQSPYNFALNNPINFRDPSGLAPEKEKGDRVLGTAYGTISQSLENMNFAVMQSFFGSLDNNIAKVIYDANQFYSSKFNEMMRCVDAWSYEMHNENMKRLSVKSSRYGNLLGFSNGITVEVTLVGTLEKIIGGQLFGYYSMNAKGNIALVVTGFSFNASDGIDHSEFRQRFATLLNSGVSCAIMETDGESIHGVRSMDGVDYNVVLINSGAINKGFLMYYGVDGSIDNVMTMESVLVHEFFGHFYQFVTDRSSWYMNPNEDTYKENGWGWFPGTDDYTTTGFKFSCVREEYAMSIENLWHHLNNRIQRYDYYMPGTNGLHKNGHPIHCYPKIWGH